VHKPASCVYLIAALLSCGLPGQERKTKEDSIATRSVIGVVTDASGNAVAKAVVQLKDTKSLQIRSFITNPDGSYHFAGLSSNVEYQLKAEYEGAFSGKKTLSVFNSKKSVTINLKLKKSAHPAPAPSP
jgi:Carboxypeptidase regulatory-like domain